MKTALIMLGVSPDIIQEKRREALEEKNKLIERILHTNPNTIYIYSLITGETKFISQNVYYYLGYTDEELISLKNYIGSMLIHPEDREKLRRNIEKIKNLKDGFQAELSRKKAVLFVKVLPGRSLSPDEYEAYVDLGKLDYSITNENKSIETVVKLNVLLKSPEESAAVMMQPSHIKVYVRKD